MSTIAFHTSKRAKKDNLSHLKEEKKFGGNFCGSKFQRKLWLSLNSLKLSDAINSVLKVSTLECAMRPPGPCNEYDYSRLYHSLCAQCVVTDTVATSLSQYQCADSAIFIGGGVARGVAQIIDTIGHAQGIGNDHSNTLIFQCTLRVRF